MRGPDQRSPDLYADLGVALFEIPPLSVEPILILVGWVSREPVDIDEVRLIPRVGPTEMLVVTVKHERRPGEKAARYVPPFATIEHRLIPCDWPAIRLVRIDEEPRRPVRRPPGTDGDGVRSHGQSVMRDQECVFATLGDPFAALRLGQLQQHFIEPVKERQLEDEARNDILSGERQSASHCLAGMESREIV